MFTFKKEERLCSKRLIEYLFHRSSSFLLYPYRVSLIGIDQLPSTFPAQVLFNVPKKRFRRAVDRNLLKRRMREAYRLHKGLYLYPLLKQRNQKMLLAINYVGNEIREFAFLEKKMVEVFHKLEQYLPKHV